MRKRKQESRKEIERKKEKKDAVFRTRNANLHRLRVVRAYVYI